MMRASMALACLALLACDRTEPGAPKHPVEAAARPAQSAPHEPPEPPAAPFVPERVTGEAKAMGTHLVYAAYTNEVVDAADAQRAFAAATAEFERLEALMTTWNDRSEISRVNAAAGERAVQVSPDTFKVVAESVVAGQLSKGTFDITFETLHGLWKFDEDLEPVPPPPAALKKQLALVGYRNIELDAARSTLFLKKKGTRIGLGGIAKGYAVDRAADILAAAGLRSFFVQAGGDLLARGLKPNGEPWSAGVRDPRGPRESFFALVPLSDHAFSTAGDYERSYVVNGKRYHHILDPRTGYPATACRSVTVWAPTALQADAIDDAVFILGPKEGLALVESQEGVGAVIVDSRNEVWISKRLQPLIRVVAAPTDGI